MDHIVYTDVDARELERLILGTKTMIVRRAKEVPCETVNPHDTLYFIHDGDRLVRAKAAVKDVLYSGELTERASTYLLQAHQDQLQLTKKEMERWKRKRDLVLIAVENITLVRPFAVDRSAYKGQGTWLPVGDIRTVKISGWSPWLARKRVYRDIDLISDR
jgi:hypothetical protein